MEIEENVNPRTEKRQFSKMPSENRKNMQSHIVTCDSSDYNSTRIRWDCHMWALKQSSRVRRGNQTRLSPLTEPYVRASYTAPVYSPSTSGNRNTGSYRTQVIKTKFSEILARQSHAGLGASRATPGTHFDPTKLSCVPPLS
jgi:hypothetical protein